MSGREWAYNSNPGTSNLNCFLLFLFSFLEQSVQCLTSSRQAQLYLQANRSAKVQYSRFEKAGLGLQS